MRELTGITDSKNQEIYYTTEYGQIVLKLRYSTITASWYMSVKWEDFELKERLLQRSDNWLNQYRRILGWGIQVVGDGKLDLCQPNDFTENGFKLYLLNSDEVYYITNITYRYNSDLVEEYFYGE